MSADSIAAKADRLFAVDDDFGRAQYFVSPRESARDLFYNDSLVLVLNPAFFHGAHASGVKRTAHGFDRSDTQAVQGPVKASQGYGVTFGNCIHALGSASPESARPGCRTDSRRASYKGIANIEKGQHRTFFDAPALGVLDMRKVRDAGVELLRDPLKLLDQLLLGSEYRVLLPGLQLDFLAQGGEFREQGIQVARLGTGFVVRIEIRKGR